MSNCEIFKLSYLIGILLFSSCSNGYKPVVIIHGVLTGNITMLPMAQRIKAIHPGTEVYAPGDYGGWSSLAPLWRQVQDIGSYVIDISDKHPEGINLIGYSQGGLIARAILEHFPYHNVDTFISLSAPQAGQYGTRFLHLFFPDLVCHTAYELFYSSIGQHTSVGNYWNDPHHHTLYLNYSRFLPYVNNEIITDQSHKYKYGMTRLKKLVLIGGPDDGVITPWQSSHFGYYDEKEHVVEMRKRQLYAKDRFGLQTLDKKKKLKIITLNGVSHFMWHTNKTVLDKFIIPFLN